jgi:hypothetical protein
MNEREGGSRERTPKAKVDGDRLADTVIATLDFLKPSIDLSKVLS